MAEVQQDEQDPQYQFFLYLCLSEEALEVQVTNDSSITNVDEVVRQDPMLERFVGYKDDITKPRFIDMGRQGFVFRFKYREQDLCLKVVCLCPHQGLEISNDWACSSIHIKHHTMFTRK